MYRQCCPSHDGCGTVQITDARICGRYRNRDFPENSTVLKFDASKGATFMRSDEMIALAIDKNNHLLTMLDEKQ